MTFMSRKKFIKAVNNMFNGSALIFPHSADPDSYFRIVSSSEFIENSTLSLTSEAKQKIFSLAEKFLGKPVFFKYEGRLIYVET